jgi:hypothetical protein
VGSDEEIAELLPQITGEASFAEHCVGAPGICVLAVLDAESPSHKSTQKALAELAVQRHGQPFGFCWVDGREFQGVAAALGLLQSDVPGVVALSAKRLRYAALPSTRGADGVGEFMDGVLSGKVCAATATAMHARVSGPASKRRDGCGLGVDSSGKHEAPDTTRTQYVRAPQVRTESLDALPEILPGSGGQAGGAAGAQEVQEEEEEVEEEFDLSDIMAEEVEDVATDRAAQVRGGDHACMQTGSEGAELRARGWRGGRSAACLRSVSAAGSVRPPAMRVTRPVISDLPRLRRPCACVQAEAELEAEAAAAEAAAAEAAAAKKAAASKTKKSKKKKAKKSKGKKDEL